jgi:hypothetical protein
MQPYKLLNTDGHLSDGGILLYADALKLDRTGNVPVEVREHVKDCFSCKRSVQEVYDIVQRLDYAELPPHPYLDQNKTRSSSSWGIITRMAAVLVVAGGLGLLAYVYLSDTDLPVAADEPAAEPADDAPVAGIEPEPPVLIEPEVVTPEVKSPSERPADMFAANFEPSLFYEALAGQQFRAQALRVLAPSIGEKASGEMRFSWQGRNIGDMHLQILDNRENTVYKTTTNRTSYLYDVSDLDPGIYYWRLETDEELVYVGKFIVPLP